MSTIYHPATAPTDGSYLATTLNDRLSFLAELVEAAEQDIKKWQEARDKAETRLSVARAEIVEINALLASQTERG